MKVDSQTQLSDAYLLPIIEGMDDELDNLPLQDASTNGADSVYSGLLYEKSIAQIFNMGLLTHKNLSDKEHDLLNLVKKMANLNSDTLHFIRAHQVSGNQKADVIIDMLSNGGNNNRNGNNDGSHESIDKISSLVQNTLAISVKNTPEQTQFGFYKPEDFFAPFMDKYPQAVQGFYKFLGHDGWGQQFKKDFKQAFKEEGRERYYLDELSVAERQEINELLTEDAFLLHLMHLALKGKGENQADFLLSPESQKNDLDNLKILSCNQIIDILSHKFVGTAISYQALNTPINIWDEPARVKCTVGKNGGYKPPEYQGGIYLLDNLFYLQRKGSTLNPTHIQIKCSVAAFDQLILKHTHTIKNDTSIGQNLNVRKP